ncbi:MAG: tyrosine--tRNA ligase, partial [Minisyncoccia bacterium]
MEVFLDLEKRGLIYQCSNFEGLKKALGQKDFTLYCGFDPTAESLHLGHLLPILTLKRFLNASNKVIVLIGGGTALIGDPSGKRKERELLPLEKIEEYKKKIEKQIKNIFQKSEKVKFVDNYQWLKEIDLIQFLRDIGKDFTIAYMLSKES